MLVLLQKKVPKASQVDSAQRPLNTTDPAYHLQDGSSSAGWPAKSSRLSVKSMEGHFLEAERENSSGKILESDDDTDSLESNVGSDLLTNVEGQIESLSSRPKLTGVRIVDEEETENVGMKNVAKLLRRRRYHDDDISQPASVPKISVPR